MPSLTANGGTNPSALHGGITWKRRYRTEKAAQLQALGVLSDKEIADHIGVTQAYFSVLKTTREFKAASIRLITGIIDQETQAICRNIEYQREELADMVPLALQKLRQVALSSNPHLALKASLEILDRDGKHSKVSRTSVIVENHIDLSTINAVGNNILNILRQEAPGSIPNAPTTIDGSTTTIHSSQVAEDVLSQFTRSASEATKQVNEMAEIITEQTLEDIESVSKTVQ